MTKTISKALPFVLVAVSGSLLVRGADLTADEIAQKNAEARGGVAKLKALRTVKMTGKALVGNGMEAEAVMQMKRPNMVRMDMTIQGQQVTQAANATSAWMINPFMGGTDPQAMPEEMASDLRGGADFEGPLVDYQAKGNKIELVGKQDVDGKPTYVLKLTRKNGKVDTFYIDASTFLDVKRVSQRNVMGQDMELDMTVGNYKNVDGVEFPFSIQQTANGNPSFSLTIDKIETNIPIDDSIFEMPKKEAPPATEKK
jgi:outer membrane lipoprotein-sorting protein